MTIAQNIHKYKNLFTAFCDNLQKEYQKEARKELDQKCHSLIQEYYLNSNSFSGEDPIPYDQVYNIQLMNNTFKIQFNSNILFRPDNSFPLPVYTQSSSQTGNAYILQVLKTYLDDHQKPNSFIESYKKAIKSTVLKYQKYF